MELWVGDWVIIVSSGVATLVFGTLLAGLVHTIRRMTLLSDVDVPGDARPRVTAVTPACDEEASVEATVTSFLAQESVDVDVVAIDDRSRDATGEILDRLAAADDRVTALHVEELPEGWLGKVHALDVGVREAGGDWLLFADADVRLSSRTLARAIAYAEARELDLLSAYPEIESAGFWGDVAWSYIGTLAGVTLAPTRLRSPDSRHAIAIGAFILVRRSAFEETPGLSYIGLEVADDMGLAILMKDHDLRCDMVNGRGEVRLTWYTSLRDMVVRSQKNFFGILCRFSLLRGILLAALTAAVGLTPLLMLVPASSPLSTALPVVPTTLFILTSALHARWAARPVFPSLFVFVGALLIAFAVLRSAIVGARLGGITWRGVLYPSEQLRDVQRFGR
jgi:glycosyltransferase involved in cell wall biosynthesis